jgi:hypothetical protein
MWLAERRLLLRYAWLTVERRQFPAEQLAALLALELAAQGEPEPPLELVAEQAVVEQAAIAGLVGQEEPAPVLPALALAAVAVAVVVVQTKA